MRWWIDWRISLSIKMWQNHYVLESCARMRTFAHRSIASIESTSDVYFTKVVVEWSIVVTVEWRGTKHVHFQPKITRNLTFHLLMREVTASWQSIHYGTSALACACLLVGSSSCAWLGLATERQNALIPSQYFFISAAVPLIAWSHVQRVHYHPCITYTKW
jgi:hypothetical protein